jgi:hypothetical protein
MTQMMESLNMRVKSFKPQFVDRIPEHIEDHILYICLECNITIHKCACGCNEEVALPLDPKQWKLIYDGETVSLTPSIGNWSYKCKSHYFITNNNVEWADTWTGNQIKKSRKSIKKKSFWDYFKI